MFVHPNTSKIFTFNIRANCDTEHIVYLAVCTACTAFYIGKTDRKLKNRIREHIYQIRIKSEVNALSKHILQKGLSRQFKFMVIQINVPNIRGGDVRNKTEQIETDWIIKMQAHIPPGLNGKIPVKSALKGRNIKY